VYIILTVRQFYAAVNAIYSHVKFASEISVLYFMEAQAWHCEYTVLGQYVIIKLRLFVVHCRLRSEVHEQLLELDHAE